MRLFLPLEPNPATLLFDENGPVRHPYFCAPEIHMHRVHTVTGSELNFESWICEVYIPYTDRTCIEDERQVTQSRGCISVRIIQVTLESEQYKF